MTLLDAIASVPVDDTYSGKTVATLIGVIITMGTSMGIMFRIIIKSHRTTTNTIKAMFEGNQEVIKENTKVSVEVVESVKSNTKSTDELRNEFRNLTHLLIGRAIS